MSEKLALLKSELEEAQKKAGELKEKIWQEIVEQKLHTLDLSAYEGKRITSITGVSSDGKAVYIPTDEICTVQDGKLYASSFDNGIVNWSDEGFYESHYHHHHDELDIIGFTDIECE